MRGTTARRVAVACATIENLRPDELAEELRGRAGRAVLLVDVRSADELRAGFIDGAVNVPRGMIELSPQVAADPTRRIVVYCDNGERSALAAARLYELGCEDVAHLDGGLEAWRDAGLGISNAARE